MRKKGKRILTLLLALLLLCTAMPVYAAESETGFPDVTPGVWYEKQLLMMQKYTPGIINGLDDENGVRIFNPDGNVKRGEFLRMIMVAAEGYTADKSRNHIHWSAQNYTIAAENNVLVADVYSGTNGVDLLFPCTYAELEKPITRYEMAVILNNVCTNMLMEKTVVVDSPESYIPDYSAINSKYTTAVEQSYGKGLLSGYEDGSFGGDRNLRRCEAASVIYRLLWSGDRKMASWATNQPVNVTSSNLLDPSLSFAHWLQQGHINGYGNLDNEARIKLFGSSSKSYFYSSADAAPYMTTVSVPIWTVDKAGNKYSSTCAITVHYLVADEVKSIFQMIYDDPEQFPIYGGWSAGGARYTDTMRHSWGCAIDVNAYYNCECDFRGYGGSLRVTCGYGWWPQLKNSVTSQPYGASTNTTYIGSMGSASPYSIGSNEGEYGYSVVKAFKTYGWGWGGQGYSSGKHDFMHFSVMPSGG